MFPKQNRFDSRIKGDFFTSSIKKHSSFFILYSKKNLLNICRAAVIVPKKAVSKSTKRSEIKRQMRNAIIPHLNAYRGFDIVLYLKSLPKSDGFLQKIKLDLESILSE